VAPNRVAQKIPGLILAAAMAAVVAGAYSSFVSPFDPIRIDIVHTDIDSSHRFVTIALPDLSGLRGQPAIVALGFRNRDSEPKRIGVLREGFPKDPVVLAPDSRVRWNIVLPPETLQTLSSTAAEGPPSLELTGDAENWTLTDLEIRNYRWRFAGVTVIPRPENESTIFSRVSPYRVVVSPYTFFVIAAALLSTPIVYLFVAARPLVTTAAARAARFWNRHELTLERGAALSGLGAIAVAQPIFEVISRSPEFFAARGTVPATAIAAVVLICFGVPFVLVGTERAMRAIAPRAAVIFHAAVLAVLAAAVVMPAFQRSDDLTSSAEGAMGAVIGLAVAVAYTRIRTVRQFFTALAPAAVVVPALFLLNPDVQRNFLPSESPAAVQTIARTPPIVLVVFDELPLNSLLDRAGTLDAGRYPNFAAFARDSYWFRNATTVWHDTSYAVPAILSGRYPPAKAVPTLRYYPVNLFTTLARHYDIVASMRYQQLCPPRACQDQSAMTGDTIQSLLSDLRLVWLHIVLPQALTDDLPPVDADWAEFGGAREARPGPSGATGRGGVFEHFLAAIDQRPARLYFIHSMVPHMAFEYVPSGRRYSAPDSQTRHYRRARLFEGRSAAYADALHQRHLAQVGFVDRLVGRLTARLREQRVYDQALVIVTADHGASYREGRSRRQPQPDNVSDIVGVPLFIKLPGQQHAEAVDRVVETVDILPTILDVVGATASLRLDGHSLLDASWPQRGERPFLLRARYRRPPTDSDVAADRAASLERKDRRFGSGDFAGIYAPPEYRHLLGTTVPHPVAQPDVQITIRDPQQFASVDRSLDMLPLYVQGVLHTARLDPLTVAVVVNGTIAAVTHSYRDRRAHVFGVLIPEASLRDGNNRVSAFVVDESPAKRP
jgi:hypothetical protein